MKTKQIALNLLLTCGILSAGFQSASADNNRDPFDYTDGSDLLGQAGGSGWGSSGAAWYTYQGNGTLTVEAGSLTYPGITSSGAKVHISNADLSTSTGAFEYRQFNLPNTSYQAGQTIYARVLLQKNNATRRYFGLSLYDTLNNTSYVERMLIGNSTGYTNWTLNNVAVTNFTPNVTNTLVSAVDPLAGTALLVVKLELLPGAERVTFWVNPDLSQPEDPSTAVGGQSFMTVVDCGNIEAVRLGGGNNSVTFGPQADFHADEIAIGLDSPFAPTITESIDYPDTSDLLYQAGGNGWGWSGAAWYNYTGNGTLTVEAGSLTYPGIASSGAKVHISNADLSTSTGAFEYRQFDQNVSFTNGHTIYARVLLQKNNATRRYFGLSLYDTLHNTSYVERMLIGSGTGYTNWTLNHVAVTNLTPNVTNTLVSTVDPLAATAALLVVKLELLSGPERVTFWVNPDLSQPEDPSTAVGGQSFMTDADLGNIEAVRLGGGNNSVTFGPQADFHADEIAIGLASPFVPVLGISQSGGNIVLSWPQYQGSVLQENTSLTGGTWVDIQNTVGKTSTNLPAANPMDFYRLRRP
jgi:hypothetical protein